MHGVYYTPITIIINTNTFCNLIKRIKPYNTVSSIPSLSSPPLWRGLVWLLGLGVALGGRGLLLLVTLRRWSIVGPYNIIIIVTNISRRRCG